MIMAYPNCLYHTPTLPAQNQRPVLIADERTPGLTRAWSVRLRRLSHLSPLKAPLQRLRVVEGDGRGGGGVF